MVNLLIGTAGHIDHGKSRLVKALTGYDSDRLPEEKKRGISIELGFTPLVLPSGLTIGLVDVPGHERFIKTMLTGVSGIDAVLFLIAANEGVMPQTREHLDIIELLAIKRGLVILSKCDLAAKEQLAERENEVKEFLKNSCLKNAPLIKTSAQTGEGLPQLLEHLALLVKDTPPRSAQSGARLPIDRVFSLAGQGTIVTGTLWGGEIKKSAVLELLWQNKTIPVRVRKLQVYGQDRLSAGAGERVALNLPGLEKNEAPRGAWLAEQGLLRPSYRLDLRLEVLSSAEKIKNGQKVHLHHAAQETLATIRLLDKEEVAGGQSCFCQALLADALPALAGDKVILRFYSPPLTIAGATVLDPAPPRHPRYQKAVLELLSGKAAADPARITLSCLEDAAPLSLATLAEKTGLPRLQLEDQLGRLVRNDEVLLLSGKNEDYCLSKKTALLYQEQVRAALTSFHQEFPLRSGLPAEDLKQRLFFTISRELFQMLLADWREQGLLAIASAKVSLADFSVNPGAKEKGWRQKIAAAYLANLFAPPLWRDAARAAAIPLNEQKELLCWLLSEGCLVKAANDLYFHPRALTAAPERLSKFREENRGFTLAEAKDLLGVSRQHALELLQCLDSKKITRRAGDLRYFLNKD